MTRGKVLGPSRVLGCSLFHTDVEEPLGLISKILQRSGVRIAKVDKTTSQITGRIGSILEPHSCKVTVRVYSQKDLSLIELVCEGAWGRPGEKTLSNYVDVLCSNLDDVSLADIERTIRWEPDQKEKQTNRRARTEAVSLLNSMEAELG